MKSDAPKEQETQALKEEVCDGKDEEPEENWDWNGGDELYYPENGSCQNWAQDEIEIGDGYAH